MDDDATLAVDPAQADLEARLARLWSAIEMLDRYSWRLLEGAVVDDDAPDEDGAADTGADGDPVLVGGEFGWPEYELLTYTWRKVVGELHPDDPPLSEDPPDEDGPTAWDDPDGAGPHDAVDDGGPAASPLGRLGATAVRVVLTRLPRARPVRRTR